MICIHFSTSQRERLRSTDSVTAACWVSSFGRWGGDTINKIYKTPRCSGHAIDSQLHLDQIKGKWAFVMFTHFSGIIFSYTKTCSFCWKKSCVDIILNVSCNICLPQSLRAGYNLKVLWGLIMDPLIHSFIHAFIQISNKSLLSTLLDFQSSF